MPIIPKDELINRIRDCKKFTTEEVRDWAQAIYDCLGPPPYSPQESGIIPTPEMVAFRKVEAELLTDFMVFWMPHVKQKEDKT